MNLRAEIYKEKEDKFLHFIGKGECIAYSVKAEKDDEDYVSFCFGEYRIHINRNDFKEFCKRFVKGNKNVSLLRPHS